MDLSPVLWVLTLSVAVFAALSFYFWSNLRRQTPIPRAVPSIDQQRLKNYANILENGDDVSWLIDVESRCLIYVTPSIEWQCGWLAAELIGKPALGMLPTAVANRIDSLVAEMKKRSENNQTDRHSERIEIDVPMKSGGSMPVETEYKFIYDTHGKPTLLLGVSRDITQRRRTEKTLREVEERVQLALKCSGDGVWDVNRQTGAMTFVDGWEDVLGYKANELQSTTEGYFELVHPDDRATLQTETQRHFDGESPSFQCEFRMRTKEGGWRWVVSRGRLLSRTAEGLPLRMIGTHTDITARKVAEVAMSRTNVKLHAQIEEIRALQSQLAEQAVRDPLTALFNRRYLDETLDREVARARREGNPLSMVMLDVDHFKNLNDSYGHQAGDQVLKALADLLREGTRAEDVPCRYGGEEFLVLLPSMSLENARERAEHWRRQLEQHTFTFGNFSLTATASFGVSSYPHHGKTPDELTRTADAALYQAKHNGRNRVEVYDESPILFVTGHSSSAG